SYTLTLILQQIAIVGILGAAQTLVILTAGIDLSIGVIMVISAVIMGNCAVTYGLPTLLAVVIGLGAGAACGLLNGLLVAYMKLPPFIVTLGTWNIVMATNFIYSANETIRDADVDVQAPLLHLFGLNFKVGTAVLTFGVIAMVVLVMILWYVLNHTAWGRHVYAVGDDPEAAKLSGIQTKKVLISVYTLAGLIAAFAAWVSIGRNGSISPSAAVTDYNLQAITATVIGGISLFGGRGSILGTLFGAMIVGVVSMGLNMLGADPQWKVLLTGVLIIGAVAIDQWIRKVSV
ncbi:MAG: ABC transporter permease, partial [Mesorhizobium sp.]